MNLIILRFFRHFLVVLPLLLFVKHGIGATIYAYVDTEGKLLISKDRSDVRYVKFEPRRRVASNGIAFGAFSSRSPRATLQNVSWVSRRAGARFASPIIQSQQAGSDSPTYSKALYYTTLINNIAEEIGVNANLLHAIIQVESAYNPSATSSKGAQGLMQLIPATAERFGVDHSYDPAANVRGGARYVKNLLVRFDNNLQLALAAYNAGEGTVQKYNNTIPPYPETQAYVTRVLSLFAQREE